MRKIPVKPLMLLLLAAVLTSCAGFRDRENLRQGLLVLNLNQRDFLEVWDTPTHTSAISGDEIIRSGIAGWGGFFFKGREMYEMWAYEGRQTRLVFYNQKLVAWKTALPVQKLATPEPRYGFAYETIRNWPQTVVADTAAPPAAPAAAPAAPAPVAETAEPTPSAADPIRVAPPEATIESQVPAAPATP